MNDPHVVSLSYRIDMSDTVCFDRAPPKMVDRGAFRITLDAGAATAEMVDHFGSVEEARQVVEPFLRAWEFDTDLRGEHFRFVYQKGELIDRNPATPASVVVAVGAGSVVVAGMDAVIRVGRSEWPDPPQGLAISPDVDALWRRWWRYREQKQEGLLAAAYWALTVLEAAPGVLAPAMRQRRTSKRRQNAAAFFNIELEVLNKIGELTSTRGGEDESRKDEGRATPLSPAERRWLAAALQALVRRVAEQAYHRGPPPSPLRMCDLPQLTP